MAFEEFGLLVNICKVVANGLYWVWVIDFGFWIMYLGLSKIF